MGPVYLVRHTPAAIDADVCYGASDVPCNATKLKAALPWLDSILPRTALLVSSPLSRCASLANALADRAPKRSVRFDPRLAERDCGAWERMRWGTVPRKLDAWAADFMHYAAPRAETVHQLQTRVLDAWRVARDVTTTRPLVIVSHAGPIQVILAQLELTPLATHLSMPVPQGSVVIAHRKADRWQLKVRSEEQAPRN
jgi:alpha-ribazole phosphatase